MNHGMIDWWNCLNGVVFFYFRCRSPLQLHNFRRNRSKSIFQRKIASKLFSDTRRKKRFKCDEFSVGYERMRESKREPWLSAVFHLYPFRWNHRAQFFYAMPNKSIQFPFVIGPVNIASQHGCSIFGATSCQFNIYNFFDNKFIIAHIRNISKSISCVSIMLHKYYCYYEKEEENSRRLSEWDEMLIEKCGKHWCLLLLRLKLAIESTLWCTCEYAVSRHFEDNAQFVPIEHFRNGHESNRRTKLHRICDSSIWA